MSDVPEMPREEHKPIGTYPKPTVDLGKPVPVPPFSKGPKVSLAEKAVLPARKSLTWDGIRHFLYGAIQGGGGAALALGAVAMKVPGLVTAPIFWGVSGVMAVLFGICEAGRKVAKVRSGGKDWTDVLYQILELVLKFFSTRKEGTK